ncbi:MAG: hypothetical protein JWP96_1105 [Polaromonas sp.]|nr:hypothetical protein [Polaromonas sp.]
MNHAVRTGLLAVSLLCGMPAGAAWLQLCPAGGDASGPVAHIVQPDGAALQAFVTDAPAAPPCEQIKLDISAGDITALRPITPSIAAALAVPFTLSGKAQGEHFLISEITPGKPAAPELPVAQPLPLGRNLLDSLRARRFGVENRVDVSLKNGQLQMQCHPGQHPAGVVLDADAYRPRARSRLQLQGSGSGAFKIITANAAQAASGSGSPVGLFQAQLEASTQAYALEPASSGWRHWTLACPAEPARLQLDSLRLMPQPSALPPRAAWVWQADEWQNRPQAVFELAQQYGIGTLYIAIPLGAGAVLDPKQLAAFIQHAGKAGLRVWAVDGDPNMVRLKEHAATLERARAYTRFNQSAPPDGRLQGVQFDIEPYLLPGYELATPAWDERYTELVKALHASVSEARAGMALEMVVPFWWAGKQNLLDILAPWVSSLAVMDYRTDPDEIYRFAVPFLDWGDRHGKAVRIALEAGPVEAETRYRYEKAAAGELWQVQLGQQPFLVMLKLPRRNPHGAAFKLSGSFQNTGSATTFHGDNAMLLRQLPALETMFVAWPGFAGMALHEVR